jgi:ABC-type transport system substrate-binding protein
VGYSDGGDIGRHARRGRRVGVSVVPAIVTLAMLVLAGCGSAVSSSQRDPGARPGTSLDAADLANELPPRDGGSIKVGLIGEPASLLPPLGRFTPPDLMIARAIYDPLVALGADGTWHPYLAQSMTPDSTGLNWTIKLRDGVLFHDGEKFDADALITNLDSFRGSPITGPAFAVVASTKKVDDLTVVVTLIHPNLNLPYSLLGQGGLMAAPAQLKAKDNRHPIGTGPFVFGAWTKGQDLTVTKNPNYWRQGLPHLDGVTFEFLPDPLTRADDFASGQIDLVHDNRPVNIEQWTQNGLPNHGKLLLDSGEGDELTVTLNTQSGVMSDESLRRALALSTDRQQLTDQISQGTYEVASSPYAKSSPWYTDVAWPAPDLDQARAITTAWKAEHNGQAPVIRLSTTPDTDFARIAQLLQTSWQAAGFDVHIDQLESTEFTLRLVLDNFDAAIVPAFHGSDPSAEEPFVSKLTVTLPGFVSLNYARYTSPVVEEALKEGRESTDPATRKAAYAHIWEDYATHFPYLWLFHLRWAVGSSDRVHGVGKLELPDGSPARPVDWGTTMLASIWVDS